MDTTTNKKQIKILALFGKSGVGKDTIQNWIVSNVPHTKKMVLCTTRPQREHEINHINYHFLTSADFFTNVMEGKMLEYSTFNNWYYGIPLTEITSSNLINVGVFSLSSLKNLLCYPTDTKDFELIIQPLYIIVDDKTRLLRVLEREDDPNCHEICRRFLADDKDFANIDFKYHCYYNMTDTNFNSILNDSAIRQFLEVNND